MEKRFEFNMKFGMYIYIKKRNLTSISRINGHENGIKLFRILKNTVFDINHPKTNQKYLKKHIFSNIHQIDFQAKSILQIDFKNRENRLK